MKVLVTGAGGFIGSHLVESQLAGGHFVCGVDLNFERLAHIQGHPRFRRIVGDIRSTDLLREIVRGIAVAYHLASAHLDVRLPDEQYRQVNVGATLSLLEAARRANVKRFVHCSSAGVVGDVTNPPADEATPCGPTNIYERTKLDGEREALEFARRTGFRVVAARPSWVYGPRCPRTEKLILAIAKGRFIIFGDGQTLRHPIYVTDAVHGLELCARSENACGQVYILAGERPVTIEELVCAVSNEFGTGPPKLRLPLFLGILASAGVALIFRPLGRQPPLSRRSMDFFMKNNAYDICKARRDLGYEPRVDLAAGMRETIRQRMHRVAQMLRQQTAAC